MKKQLKRILALVLTSIIVCSTASVGAIALPDTWKGGVSSGFDSGDGTEGDPYIIKTAEQLAYLSTSVMNGQTYKGKYIKLAGNVELNDTSNYLDWRKTAPENNWRAIGGYYHISITSQSEFDAAKTQYGSVYRYVSVYSYYENTTYSADISDYYFQRSFMGVFDGDGYTVNGIYISASEDYQGLFGLVTGGTLKNVTVARSYINGRKYIAGAAGYISGDIYNCCNKATVRGKNNAGGIAGYLEGAAEFCRNIGKINATNEYAGGIAAQLKGTLRKCVNSGAVGGTRYLGGINGWNESGRITSCRNEGNVDGNLYIGGISGYNNSGIDNCCNMSSVVCTDSYAGGITGINRGKVSLCCNTGKVYGWVCVGGNSGYGLF